MTDKEIFDAIRARRGAPLTPEHVAIINGIMYAQSNVPIGGIALVKEFEGCKLAAYPDPATGGDPWTIGWGATGDGIKRGVTWTQKQADDRLEQDFGRFVKGVVDRIGGASTTSNQLGAMASLAYNVGLGNFEKSTLLKKHKAGDFAGAAAEFAKWNRANGSVMAGLTRRRAAEAALYRS